MIKCERKFEKQDINEDVFNSEIEGMPGDVITEVDVIVEHCYQLINSHDEQLADKYLRNLREHITQMISGDFLLDEYETKATRTSVNYHAENLILAPIISKGDEDERENKNP
jgi:hypothetical protein